MRTTISKDKKEALQFAQIAHNLSCYKVYCDGSGYKGSTAVLYKGDRVVKSLLYHIGPTTKHTVFETELIGLLLAFHLLSLLMYKLSSSTVVIGLDNQAAIKALRNQETKPAHYLLDQIHTAAECLQVKQDRIIRKLEFQHAKHNNRPLKARTRGVFDLNIHWVPSHNDFKPNKKADEVAKWAALGKSSPSQSLPAFLRKPVPLSVAALSQESRAKTQRVWLRRWKGSLMDVTPIFNFLIWFYNCNLTPQQQLNQNPY